jgi:hypothetical protein
LVEIEPIGKQIGKHASMRAPLPSGRALRRRIANSGVQGLVNRSGRHQWDLLRIGDRLEHALRRGLNDAGKPEGQFRI